MQLRPFLLLTLITASVWAMPLKAAEFCVTNVTELTQALSSAANNGESDTIKLQTGTYSLSSLLQYIPHNSTDMTTNLRIEGGFTEFFGNPCGQHSNQPELTMLHGQNTTRIMYVILPHSGNVEIRNLQFSNGHSPTAQGAGLHVRRLSGAPYSGKLTVSHNIFSFNNGNVAAGLSVYVDITTSANIQVLNNLFIGNSNSANGNAPASITVRDLYPPASERGLVIPIPSPLPAAVFAHNTVVNNQATAAPWGGVSIQAASGVKTHVSSNNIWGNSGTNLRVIANPFYLYRNNIQSSAGSTPTGASGNISVEPVYANCGILCIRMIPREDSALIDGGHHPPLLTSPWTLPSIDLAGNARVEGSRVDIGAYEGMGPLFVDRFEG